MCFFFLSHFLTRRPTHYNCRWLKFIFLFSRQLEEMQFVGNISLRYLLFQWFLRSFSSFRWINNHKFSMIFSSHSFIHSHFLTPFISLPGCDNVYEHKLIIYTVWHTRQWLWLCLIFSHHRNLTNNMVMGIKAYDGYSIHTLSRSVCNANYVCVCKCAIYSIKCRIWIKWTKTSQWQVDYIRTQRYPVVVVVAIAAAASSSELFLPFFAVVVSKEILPFCLCCVCVFVCTPYEQFHESHLFYERKKTITFPLAKSFSWVNDILSWVRIFVVSVLLFGAIITFGPSCYFSQDFIQQGNLTCPSNDGCCFSGK